jgi:hypothetical protein
MRAAPPVQMACDDDGLWQAFGRSLAALAMATAVAWIAAHAGQSPLVTGLAAAVGAASALLATANPGRLARPRQLRWDGRSWALDGAGGQVAVMLDLGGWLLLRFDADSASAPHWLPLDPAACGAPAQLARAAVHAHAGARRPGLAGAGSLEPNG